MIDQTTKAKEGPDWFQIAGRHYRQQHQVEERHLPVWDSDRLRTAERVKATITSILVGDKFINVKLSVFDNDGMEGFYVPESSFREFVKRCQLQCRATEHQF